MKAGALLVCEPTTAATRPTRLRSSFKLSSPLRAGQVVESLRPAATGRDSSAEIKVHRSAAQRPSIADKALNTCGCGIVHGSANLDGYRFCGMCSGPFRPCDGRPSAFFTSLSTPH